MELRHLRYFLTLAEELHFRKAAEKLFIAQPALTRQIKELEAQLGVLLFLRDKRNVSLTLAGKFLQKEAYQLLNKVDSVKSSISELGATIAGNINIGCIGSAMVNVVPNLINHLDGQFPNVSTTIVENTTQNLHNMLLDGQIDIMFGRPHKKVESVHSETIGTDSVLLVYAQNSKWKIDESTRVSKLEAMPFLIFPRSAGVFFRDQFVNICSQAGFYPKIKHETINVYSILKLVENDIGISILPKSIAEGYRLNVNYLELKDMDISLEMVMSYRIDHQYELIGEVVKIIQDQSSNAADVTD